MSCKKKSDTLGMPFGTAQHRLRKIVLFDLLVRHKENFCFKCGLVINKIEDLSIEHKQPWEGISAELYWALSNIAFSHLRCNVPHKYGGGGRPIVGPEGMAWCCKHKAFFPRDDFYKDVVRYNGLMSWCKECHKSRAR